MIYVEKLRIDDVAINFTSEAVTLTGNYSLISNKDKVIAKQQINGYNTIKLTLSPVCQAQMEKFIEAVKEDLTILLGLEKEN